jgi:hypothetical protein
VNLIICSLISIVCLSGCISKHEIVSDIQENVINQASSQTPFWTNYNFIETQPYFYFISNFKTQFHTPTFAYRKARREFYGFMESDIDYILFPLKKHMKKSKVNELKKRFLEYIAQETLLEIRKTKKVFWKEIKSSSKVNNKVEYSYYVLIKLNKKILRLYERQFISKEILKMQYLYQSLTKKQLQYCYENIKQLDKLDSLKQPFLIETLEEVLVDNEVVDLKEGVVD